jgi:hypothetical protein
MNAPNGNAALRTGMRRIFPSWEYRHLRTWAGARIAGGTVLTGLGVVTLVGGSFSPKAIGWAGVMLVLAALAFAGGYWQLAIARSAPPQT